MAFAPLAAPLCDVISPTEAINLIAGVKSDDPFDPEAYDVSDHEIEEANNKLFGWLSSGDVVGIVETANGTWRSLDMTWLRSHRRLSRQWRENPEDPSGDLLSGIIETIDRLPDKVRFTDEPLVNGRPWFVERTKVNDCKDGLSGLVGDDRLVAKMRAGVDAGTFKNNLQASFALGKLVEGGATLESKAQRLRRREKLTRPTS